MKKNLLLPIIMFLSFSSLMAQTTNQAVYQIFKQKCASCHSHADPQSGLDLEGTGANDAAKALNVYNNIVGVNPANNYAAEKGYKYVYPGRADKSFLFRKINQGLEETITLHTDENAGMPAYGGEEMTDVEKELIRQWILFGAPSSGNVVDETKLTDYYAGNGLESFPDGAPEAPLESEGFQVKMGPFFLEPGGEIEYFSKYELDLPEGFEVNRLDIKIANYSHHFILYKFDEGAGGNVNDGLRVNANHANIGYVATVQGPQDIRLPEGTAFSWENNTVLDLNSHYINYDVNNVFKAEVYFNVYTQPAGTAAQEMYSTLVPNPFIYIPNNGNEVDFTDEVTQNGKIWLWNIGGHTHRYGTDYDIWTMDEAGNNLAHIYDGSCPQGIPDCAAPYFDYQHIPNRTFDDLYEIDMSNGIRHRAKWVNEGPSPVFWGNTSEDEMMLYAGMYVTDTTGLSMDTTTPTFEVDPINEISVHPNPMTSMTTFYLPENIGTVDFNLYDVTGKLVRSILNINDNQFDLTDKGLAKGMFFYRIENEAGKTTSGKLFIE